MESAQLVFEQSLTIPQIVIPPICTGILLYGALLFTYVAFQTRSRQYLSIVLLALPGMVFVGSETFLVIFGGAFHMRGVGVQFHRLEQLAGAYFLFALPGSLRHLLFLSEKWRKITTVLSWSGFAIALGMTVAAFIKPELFISITEFKATSTIYECDYARGEEGPLYFLRDVILAAYILYSFSLILFDIFWNNRLKELLFPVGGVLIAIYGAVVDILFIYTGRHFDMFPHAYYSRFSLALTIMIMFFMSELVRRFMESAGELERAHETISASEKRFRFIFDGTDDILFSLGRDRRLLSANKSALNRLPLDQVDITGSHFYDLIHTVEGDEVFMQQVLDLKFEELLEKHEPVVMKLNLRARHTGEPLEYTLRLEYLASIEGEEILIRGERTPEDELAKYLEYEKGRYRLENYLTLADETSKRLVQNLTSRMDRQEINALRLALREILINAIEHGNLGISFEDKSLETERENYLAFLRERQNAPGIQGKTVTVEFRMDESKMEYKIRDDGEGFDVEAQEVKRNRVDSDMLAHGRGITMARSAFDEVRYSRKGNEVLLVKHYARDKKTD
jgi:anti-sigma regulatory factor (Ser/Thr protein kinase)